MRFIYYLRDWCDWELGLGIRGGGNVSRGPRLALIVFVLLSLAVCSLGVPHPQSSTQNPQSLLLQPSTPVSSLYDRIRLNAIDPDRVYRIDGLNIDNEDVHITLVHGTLALCRALDGKTTGAFFVGKGEVLVMPPDTANRSSLANFTGLPTLDETFSSAYFRFSDGALNVDKAEIRDQIDGHDFASQWDTTVLNLNQPQAVRLLSEYLNGGRTPYFFARVSSARLGNFDLLVDRSLSEQIVVAGPGSGSHPFEDIWASFPMRSVRNGKSSLHPEDIHSRSYRVITTIADDLSLQGTTEAEFVAVTSGDRVVVFNLSNSLPVSSIVDGDGRSVAFFQNDSLHEEGRVFSTVFHPGYSSHLVAIVLPEPLESGRSYRLTFRYSGRVIENVGERLFGIEDRADWYPHHSFEPATYDLIFNWPARLTLVATGVPAQSAPSAANAAQRTGRWVTTEPLMLAGFNLGDYTESSITTGPASPEIDIYGVRRPPSASLNASPAAGASDYDLRQIAQETQRTINFFSARFGPFPYPRLSITPLPYRFGQGWPGLLYISSLSFLNAQQLHGLGISANVQLLYNALMRPHEIAHQWWGDEVGWKDYHDQWLPESLSNYSALLFVASQPGGTATMQRILDDYRSELLRPDTHGVAPESAGPISLGLRLASSRFPDGYEIVTYNKGTWFVHMLRELLRDPVTGSDDRFFAILRDFRERFHGQAPTTADFQNAVERHLPAWLNLTQDGKLDWLFQEWLDRTGIPKYSIEDLHIQRRGGTRVVSGVLVQSGVPEDFVMPVPLYLTNGRTRTFLDRIFADSDRTSFSVKAAAAGNNVIIDPEHTILQR